MSKAICPPCHQGCDQGDTCPARVAPVKATKQRSCDELGVCHCPGNVCTSSTHHVGQIDTWYDIAYTLSVLLAVVTSTLFVLGLAGYFISKFGG